MTKTIINSVLIGLGFVALVMFAVHILGGGPVHRISPNNPDVVAVMPSLVRMADLCAGFGSWLLIVIGGLAVGFGIASGRHDVNIGSGQKSDSAIKLIIIAVGVLLVFTTYFLPASISRDFVHITTTRSEAAGITNKHFTDKNMQDPNIELYNKSFANQR